MPRTYNPASLYVAPTLVIGVGGTGVEIMRLVKGRVRQSMKAPPGIVEFLAVDTEPYQNLPGQERIFDREFAYIGDYNASSVIENLDKHKHIRDWWFDPDSKWGSVTGSIHKGARQRRCVGRLSLYVKWGTFSQKLAPKLLKIREIAEKERAQRQGMEVERNTGLVQVYIISSVCGGTGSGILLDVAFKIRKELGDDADIVAVCLMPSCFLPEVQSRIQQQRIQGNAYATLREMNHFLSGRVFEARFPDQSYNEQARDPGAVRLTRPFDSVYLLDRSNGREYLSSLDNIRRMAAQHVFLDIITPIGKKFASRRANLRDLAGEKSDLGSLAIGGFVTASLVLPSERILAAVIDRYAADFLHRRLLGSEPTPAEQQDLTKQLSDRWQSFDQALRFEQIDASIDDDPLSSRPSKRIDLSTAPGLSEQIARDSRAFLQSQFERHGLRRAYAALMQLITQIDTRVTALGEETSRLQQRTQQMQEALTTRPPQPNFWESITGSIGSLINGGQSSTSAAREDWVLQQSELRGKVDESNREIGRNAKAVEILARLRDALSDMRTQLRRRIEIFGAAADELLRESLEREQVLLVDRQPDRLTDLFELATEVGWEEHELTGSMRGQQTSFVAWFLRDLTGNRPLKPSDEDGLVRRLGLDGVFRLATATRPDAPSLSLDDSGARLPVEVQSRLLSEFQRHVGNLTPHQVGFSVMRYLDWFYRFVPYNGGISRGSPIDPLLMLRNRAILPFLEIDEARLGTEHAADTEDVPILGVGLERASDALAAHILDEFDSYEDVSTDLHDRLDVSFSRHGYRISALRQLRAYKDSYVYFMRDRKEALHIHRDWPHNMDDLLTLEADESDMPSPRPPAPQPPTLNGSAPPGELAPPMYAGAPANPGQDPPAPPSSGLSHTLLATIRPAVAVGAEGVTGPSGALLQQAALLTNTGMQRGRNEDAGVAVLPGELTALDGSVGLYVVADGMGGYEGGALASAITVRAIQDYLRAYIQRAAVPDEVVLTAGLRQAVEEAHQQVRNEAERLGNTMGCTVTAALVVGDQAVIANVGDSRTYLWRGGVLRRITQDHTLVMRLLETEVITEDELYTHPLRHEVDQGLGQARPLAPDLYHEQLLPGDRLLLCSDGLWEQVRDPQLAEIVGRGGELHTVCQALIDAANRAGGPDNITALVVCLVPA